MRYSIILVVLLLTGCSASDRDFDALKTLKKDDPAEAMALAGRLSENERGVELAIEDFSLYGGKTRGISSWILIHSPLGRIIDPKLRQIAKDPKASFSRRFEALCITWERSGFSDADALGVIVKMIEGPGDGSVMVARRRVLQVLEHPSDEVVTALLSPGNVYIGDYITPEKVNHTSQPKHDEDQRAKEK